MTYPSVVPSARYMFPVCCLENSEWCPNPRKLCVLVSMKGAKFVDAGFSTSHQMLKAEGWSPPNAPIRSYITMWIMFREPQSAFEKLNPKPPSPVFPIRWALASNDRVGSAHLASWSWVDKRKEGNTVHSWAPSTPGTIHNWMDVHVLKCTDSSPFWMHNEWVVCLLTHWCIYSADFTKGYAMEGHGGLWNLEKME